MPSYDYACDDCSVVEEHRHKVSEVDTHEAPCPECSQQMHRIISNNVNGFICPGVSRDLRERGNRAKAAVKNDQRMREHGGDQRVKSIREQMSE